MSIDLGFGCDEGPGTAEAVLIGDGNHRQLESLESFRVRMSWLQFSFMTTSSGSTAHVSERQMKTVIYFKVFIGVQHSSQFLQHSLCPVTTIQPFSSA